MKQKTWKYAPIIQLDTTNQAQTFSGTHLNMKSICIFWTFTLDCTFELQPDALGKDKNKLVFWNSKKLRKIKMNRTIPEHQYTEKKIDFFFIECTFETCSIWIFVFNICLQYTHRTHPLSFLSIIVFTFCSWYVFLDMYAPAHNEAVAVFYLLRAGKFQCVLCKCTHTHTHEHKYWCVFQMISLELLSCCFQPFVGISFFTKFVPMSNTQYGSTCTW